MDGPRVLIKPDSGLVDLIVRGDRLLHGLGHPRSPELRREALKTLEVRASVVIRVRVHELVNGDLGHGAPRAQVGPKYVSDLTCKGVRIFTRARVHRLVSA